MKTILKSDKRCEWHNKRIKFEQNRTNYMQNAYELDRIEIQNR